jgi:methionine-rich copper-binding protein CopC
VSRGRSLRRWGARLGTLVTVLTLGLLGTAAPALAHDVLISSDPADGATLDTAPSTVTFTFDQPVQNFEPVLVIIGPNGNTFGGLPTVAGSDISAPMTAGPAGQYRAAYRIVSADGHPVSGEITFTLTAAAAGTATGVPTDAAAPASTGMAPGMDMGGDSSGGFTPWRWVWIAAAVVLLIAAAARLRGRRGPRNPPTLPGEAPDGPAQHRDDHRDPDD